MPTQEMSSYGKASSKQILNTKDVEQEVKKKMKKRTKHFENVLACL